MKFGILKKMGKWLLRNIKEDAEDRITEIIKKKSGNLGIPPTKKRGR